MGILFNKNILVLVLLVLVGFVGYKVLFADAETAADACKKVADQSFLEKYGRVPDRNDFLNDEIIQKDWYPVFDKCLTENQ